MSAQVFKSGVKCSVLLVLVAVAHATEPPSLASNPFSRPPSERTAPFVSQLRTDGSPQTLDLRATMVGTRDRLANVAGKILRPGDEVQGYKLVQVFEDRAVFSRQGSRITLYVKPDLEDDDE